MTREEADGYAAEYQTGEPMGDLARALLAALDDLDAVKAELQKFHEERAYVIGANDGWDAAVEQGEASPAVGKAMVRFWKRLAEIHHAKIVAAEAANAALTARNEALVEFIAEFAAAKIEALHFPGASRNPEDELDPVVEASEVWAWQKDAATLAAADHTAALERLISRAREVKPLVWEEIQSGIWRANTVIGEYSVGFDDGWWAQLEGVQFWEWDAPEDPRSYRGPEAAQLACRADYTARIHAALAEPPAIRADVREG